MCCGNVRNVMGRNVVSNQYACGERCNMHTSTTIVNRTTGPMVQRFSCRNVPVICDNQVSTKTVCTKVVPIVGTRFDVSHRKY